MHISLDALEMLDAIDRRGSFAAAATELFRVPSAITHAVHKLESDLAVNLFDRTGHRARLTPAGRTLLDEGRHLLRAAADLECRVRRVATGWEAELRIAVDGMLEVAALFHPVRRFYAEGTGTRLRLSHEVLGGNWDALVADRADLVIGAPGDAPPASGLVIRPLCEVRFLFCIPPGHPLAALPEPLPASEIVKHRAVSVADSSRHLEARTTGLLSGQDVLTVANADQKLAAQLAGLGVGFLSEAVARREAAAGRLLIRDVVEPKAAIPVHVAWRASHRGKALKWFVRELDDPAVLSSLLQLRA